MAKTTKQTKLDTSKHSVLKAAYDALTRGDIVQARALSREIVKGTQGKDDIAVAQILSKELSTPTMPVDESPQAVARNILSRTQVAPKPFIFAAVVATIFVLLVLLATIRY